LKAREIWSLGSAAAIVAKSSATWPSTQANRASLLPVSSATGTKTSGEIGPLVGWRQRASASTERIAPVAMSTIGW
jgi:hypothetical protein